MEKNESITGYKITDETANLFDALRKLDEVFGMVAESVDNVFGMGAFDAEDGEGFRTKHTELRNELGKITFMIISENLANIEKNEI